MIPELRAAHRRRLGSAGRWAPDAALAYGRLYDLPHLQTVPAAQMSPWGIDRREQPAEGLGRPVVGDAWRRSDSRLLNGPSPDSVFPLGGNYTTHPLDLQATAVDQWNVSYQKQLAPTGWCRQTTSAVRITSGGRPDQPGGLHSGGVDRQQHAIAPRVEHAEPGGRPVLRQYPGAR